MTERKPNGRRRSERESFDRNGLIPDDAILTEREELILELVEVGIALRKAESLVDGFPYSQIRQQLAWLPKRAPRRPAPLLIASIEHHYDAPAYEK